MSSDNRIRELEELVVRLIAERDVAVERQRELESKYKTLEERNLELEKKLSFYEGPTSRRPWRPSRRRRRRNPPGRSVAPRRAIGAPPGGPPQPPQPLRRLQGRG